MKWGWNGNDTKWRRKWQILMRSVEAQLCQLRIGWKRSYEEVVEETVYITVLLGQAQLQAERQEQEKLVAELFTSEQSIVKDGAIPFIRWSTSAFVIYSKLTARPMWISNGTSSTALGKIKIASCLTEVKLERDCAILTIRHYRDLAEKLKTTNHYVRSSMIVW